MLGNKPPYTTMQQLNLDWILSKLKTLLRLVPDDGAVGQILRRTRDGAVWSDEQGGGGGAVQSVNGKTGAVVLDADDVGALPDDYTPPVTSVNGQTGAVVIPTGGAVDSVNGQTGTVVLGKSDIGLANVDNVKQYSANNPPPYPVTSVNGQTGAVVIPTGGAVDSVNGQTGAVVLDADDVGALPDTLPHITEIGTATGGWSWVLYSDNTIDLYMSTRVIISNYSASSFGGLYEFGPFNLPFALELGYSFLAGGKVGAGICMIALCNSISATRIDVIGQTNLTGQQACDVYVHLHGKKATT